MAKFFGKVGYVLEAVEVRPGVFKDQITERKYFGDEVRPSRRLDEVEKVNFDISTGTSLSIVADAYANQHFFAIRYVEWAGALWVVTSVDPMRPRLLLRLGGVYNGPRATVTN
jgi:hypothetical protein